MSLAFANRILAALLLVSIGWFLHAYFGAYVEERIANILAPKSGETALPQAPDGTFCAQVITPAVNPETGEVKEFPTTCSVPEGWEPLGKDAPASSLELI